MFTAVDRLSSVSGPDGMRHHDDLHERMTPAARINAAIGVLDRIAAGEPAERALLNWARGSRYAGSGDRAAVRDHVFDALRCRRSFAALGGSASGRGLMLGGIRAGGGVPETTFTGAGYAPAPVTPSEAAHLAAPVALSENEALDCPDWLAPDLQASLGADFASVMEALRHRAPVYLRVNTARADLAAAQSSLLSDGIATQFVQLAKNALQVTENARKIHASLAFRDGLVELQDAASQAVVEALPLTHGQRVLDYCAGGGGKALAMAARVNGPIHVHDADPARMRDLPARAARAGAEMILLSDDAVAAMAPYDLVLLDVPCSGSGSWRRTPEAKWRLTRERLEDLMRTQVSILERASSFVAPGGWMAYVTCSLLVSENESQIARFMERSPEWHCGLQHRWSPKDGADGFFLALLTRN